MQLELAKVVYKKEEDKVTITPEINIENFEYKTFNRFYDENLNAAARLQPVTMSISFNTINDESYPQESNNLESTHQFYAHNCPKFDDEHSNSTEQDALNADINEDIVYFIDEDESEVN